MVQASSESESKGASLLLRHCRALDESAPPAYSRLEAELGGDLTRLLVSALTGAHGRPD